MEGGGGGAVEGGGEGVEVGGSVTWGGEGRGGEKMISSERASQEKQNGTNFSFIAPSSEEL